MSLDLLLQAAEYIENHDNDSEHGYASINFPNNAHLCKKSSKKFSGKRSSHNELEKCRRAYLRNCLNGLKELVPLDANTYRHTTLGLLNKAKTHIKNLEENARILAQRKERACREQKLLRAKLANLMMDPEIPEEIKSSFNLADISSEQPLSGGRTSHSEVAKSLTTNKNNAATLFRYSLPKALFTLPTVSASNVTSVGRLSFVSGNGSGGIVAFSSLPTNSPSLVSPLNMVSLLGPRNIAAVKGESHYGNNLNVVKQLSPFLLGGTKPLSTIFRFNPADNKLSATSTNPDARLNLVKNFPTPTEESTTLEPCTSVGTENESSPLCSVIDSMVGFINAASSKKSRNDSESSGISSGCASMTAESSSPTINNDTLDDNESARAIEGPSSSSSIGLQQKDKVSNSLADQILVSINRGVKVIDLEAMASGFPGLFGIKDEALSTSSGFSSENYSADDYDDDFMTPSSGDENEGEGDNEEEEEVEVADIFDIRRATSNLSNSRKRKKGSQGQGKQQGQRQIFTTYRNNEKRHKLN